MHHQCFEQANNWWLFFQQALPSQCSQISCPAVSCFLFGEIFNHPKRPVPLPFSNCICVQLKDVSMVLDQTRSHCQYRTLITLDIVQAQVFILHFYQFSFVLLLLLLLLRAFPFQHLSPGVCCPSLINASIFFMLSPAFPTIIFLPTAPNSASVRVNPFSTTARGTLFPYCVRPFPSTFFLYAQPNGLVTISFNFGIYLFFDKWKKIFSSSEASLKTQPITPISPHLEEDAVRRSLLPNGSQQNKQGFRFPLSSRVGRFCWKRK